MVFLWMVLYCIVGIIASIVFVTTYYYRLYCRGYETEVLFKQLVYNYCTYIDDLSPLRALFHTICELALFILAWPIKIVWFYFAWLLPAQKDYDEALESIKKQEEEQA